MADSVEFTLHDITTLTEARQEARKVAASYLGTRKFVMTLHAEPEEVRAGFGPVIQRIDRWSVTVEVTLDQPPTP